MSTQSYDVIGLGNAIVDVIAHAQDDFIVAHDLAKGAMTLIDEARAEALYAAMGPAQIISGGCAANTAACVARTRTTITADTSTTAVLATVPPAQIRVATSARQGG